MERPSAQVCAVLYRAAPYSCLLSYSQAAELANIEFTAGVPALFRKILQKRPRIVCFVGKGIWESFIRATAPPADSPVKSEEAEPETKLTVEVATSVASGPMTPDPAAATRTKTVGATSRTKVKRTTSRKAKPEPFVYDLQPYKVVHTSRALAFLLLFCDLRCMVDIRILADAAVHETLFAVVVSTSGLVAGYQVPYAGHMNPPSSLTPSFLAADSFRKRSNSSRHSRNAWMSSRAVPWIRRL